MVVKYEQVHLQGIGKMPAKSVKDLRMGDRIIWNYGLTSQIIKMVPSKSGKTIELTTCNQDHKYFTRKKRADTLVAIQGSK